VNTPHGLSRIVGVIVRRVWLSWSPAAIFAIALVIFIGGDAYASRYFPLDDAWIHRVYSHAFAFGQGFAYNAGTQEAGSSSPLWSIVSAPLHWLEPLGLIWVTSGIKILGAAFCLAAVIFVQRTAVVVTKSRLAAAVTAALFSIQPRLLFSALSGMETSLLVALWTGVAWAWLTQKRLAALMLIGLMPATRPEALLLLPLAGLVFAQKHQAIPDHVSHRLRREAARSAWGGRGLDVLIRARLALERKYALIFVGLIAVLTPSFLWMLFCLYANGHLLPTTFYLKAGKFALDEQKLRLSFEALIQYGILPGYAVALGCLIFVCRCGVKFWYLSGVFVLAPVGFAIAVVGSREISLDGYYWTRWVDPAALLLNAAALLGIAFCVVLAFIRPSRARFRIKFIRYGVSIVGMSWMVWSAPVVTRTFLERRARLSSDSRAITLMNVQMGRWLRNHTRADDVIGINDAGAIKYFSHRTTIDLIGLNNAAIAFGKLTRSQAISRAHWLAIFPSWFTNQPRIFRDFRVRNRITIPVEEYTVCRCDGQTELMALQRVMKRH
jgi:hypothetical protein